MPNPTAIVSELTQERFTDALRKHVGPGKALEPNQLANLTGLDTRSIKAYRDGTACPCLFKFLRIAAVLPPEFTAEVLALSGLTGVCRPADDAGLLQANAQMLDAAAQIAEAYADGRVDHREQAEIDEKMRRAHAATGAYLTRRAGRTPTLREVGGGKTGTEG